MVYNYLLGSSQPPGNCFESVMDVWSKEDEKFKKIYGQDVSECVCVCVCVYLWFHWLDSFPSTTEHSISHGESAAHWGI